VRIDKGEDSVDCRNIFNLIGEYSGSNEDQLTASLGAYIALNPLFLGDFLSLVGIGVDSRLFNKIKIETQVTEATRRVDLKLSLKDKFLVFVECKLTAPIDKRQLWDYGKKLAEETNKFDDVRLLYISQCEEPEVIENVKDRIRIRKKDFIALEWKDIADLARRGGVEKNGEVIKDLFLKKWGGIMSGELDVSDSKISDAEEIMVVVTEKDCIDVVTRYNYYAHKNRLRPTMYIAFYVSHPDKEVKYFAKVKKIRYDVPRKEVKGDYYSGKGNLAIVYYLDEPIRLERRITAGERWSKKMNIFNPHYTTFEKFINARSLDDLFP